MTEQKCVHCDRKAIVPSDKCFRHLNWHLNKGMRERAAARRKEPTPDPEHMVCVGCGYLRDDPRFVGPGYAGITHHVCPKRGSGPGWLEGRSRTARLHDGCAMIALSGDDKGAE